MIYTYLLCQSRKLLLILSTILHIIGSLPFEDFPGFPKKYDAFFSLYFPCTVCARGVKLIFTGGHISLVVAFKGLNVILGLYKYNYFLTVKRELGVATGKKQGAGLDKTRWRAGFSPWALCLPPGE